MVNAFWQGMRADARRQVLSTGPGKGGTGVADEPRGGGALRGVPKLGDNLAIGGELEGRHRRERGEAHFRQIATRF